MPVLSTISSARAPTRLRRRARVSYTDHASDPSSGTIFTFTNRAIGSPRADRWVYVCVGQRNTGQTVSSMTIGGITASQVVANTGASGFNRSEIWRAKVPTGTTATIVVTWNTTVPRCAIVLIRAINTKSVIDTQVSDSDPGSVTLDVRRGGAAIAFCYGGNNGTNTWTGLTEVADDTVGSQSFTAAIGEFTSAQPALNVSVDGSNAYSDPATVAVSIR